MLLLFRILELERGQIQIDGVNIATLGLRRLVLDVHCFCLLYWGTGLYHVLAHHILEICCAAAVNATAAPGHSNATTGSYALVSPGHINVCLHNLCDDPDSH